MFQSCSYAIFFIGKRDVVGFGPDLGAAFCMATPMPASFSMLRSL